MTKEVRFWKESWIKAQSWISRNKFYTCLPFSFARYVTSCCCYATFNFWLNETRSGTSDRRFETDMRYVKNVCRNCFARQLQQFRRPWFSRVQWRILIAHYSKLVIIDKSTLLDYVSRKIIPSNTKIDSVAMIDESLPRRSISRRL